MRDDPIASVKDHLADPEAILLIDESGFLQESGMALSCNDGVEMLSQRTWRWQSRAFLARESIRRRWRCRFYHLDKEELHEVRPREERDLARSGRVPFSLTL